MLDENPELTVTLRLHHINRILEVLGEQKFSQVAELYSIVRGQAETQIERMRRSEQPPRAPQLVPTAPEAG